MSAVTVLAFVGLYAALHRLTRARPTPPQLRRVPIEQYLYWTPEQWAEHEAATGWKLVQRR